MNETTLRIYCQKKSNTEPITQDLSTPTISSTVQAKSNTLEKAKATKEKTNLQGWFFVS